MDRERAFRMVTSLMVSLHNPATAYRKKDGGLRSRPEKRQVMLGPRGCHIEELLVEEGLSERMVGTHDNNCVVFQSLGVWDPAQYCTGLCSVTIPEPRYSGYVASRAIALEPAELSIVPDKNCDGGVIEALQRPDPFQLGNYSPVHLTLAWVAVVLDTVSVPLEGNRGRDVAVESPKKPVVEPSDVDVGPVGCACVLDLDVRTSEDPVQFPPTPDSPVKPQPLGRVSQDSEPVVGRCYGQQLELNGRYVLGLVNHDVPVPVGDGPV